MVWFKSASCGWAEWHLTPHGWERGSTRRLPDTVLHRATPPDRVMTCLYRKGLASIYASSDEETSTLWVAPDSDLAAELIERFGSCPETLDASDQPVGSLRI